jgi:hypothetical protein
VITKAQDKNKNRYFQNHDKESKIVNSSKILYLFLSKCHSYKMPKIPIFIPIFVIKLPVFALPCTVNFYTKNKKL